MRVAVTGAAGRLGSALVTRLSDDPGGTSEVLGWGRAEFDLDDPGPVAARIAADLPDLIIHAAAWTDVDGCAREPGLAMRRNGDATRMLGDACAEAGVSLILVSTNEVFDGARTDGLGYQPDDPVRPPNPYGASKLAGEVGAAEAFDARCAGSSGAALGIVRTAWLFGPGKPDFPVRIAAAARSAASEGRALRLVNDEFGTPTYVPDLADAIARLARSSFAGVHHVVNAGVATRADWARDVLARLNIAVDIEEISLDEYPRPSHPPRWGVLEPTPLPCGLLRSWDAAMADRLAAMGVAE